MAKPPLPGIGVSPKTFVLMRPLSPLWERGKGERGAYS